MRNHPAVPTYEVLQHHNGVPSSLVIKIEGIELEDFNGAGLSMDTPYRHLKSDATKAIVEEGIVSEVIDLIVSRGNVSITYIGQVGSFLRSIEQRLGLTRVQSRRHARH